MTTRRLSRLVVGTALLALFTLFAFTGPSTSAQKKGDRSAPTAPTDLKINSITETTVTLSWNASTDNSGKFSYRLKINNLTNSAYNSLTTISQTQTSYTAKYLAPNSPYSFVVFAVDGSGNRSADSNTVNANTPADTTGPTKPVLEAVAVAPSQVQLTWTKSTDNVANNCCAYAFNMNGSRYTGHINWVPAPAADKLSAIIRHLTPSTTYSFSISVTEYSGGNTTTSDTKTATTHASSDTTPPTVPTNLHLVRDDSCGEIWLGWNGSSDNEDGAESIEYEIYVNDILSPLPIYPGLNLDFVYANAHGDNVFYIRAVDRSGNSSAPSEAIKLFLWPC